MQSSSVTGRNPQPRGDNVAGEYSNLEVGGPQGAQYQEAAALLVEAETLLVEEQVDDAMDKAWNAHGMFHRLALKPGEVDALRIILIAMTASDSKDSSQDAFDLASKQQEQFAAQGERRGEGVALLTLAELSAAGYGAKGTVKRGEEGLEEITRAKQLFEEAQDHKLQAIALLVHADILVLRGRKHASRQDMEEAMRLLTEARQNFKTVCVDPDLEARSSYLIALTHSFQEDWDKALSVGREAMEKWKKLGNQKFEGMMSRYLAEWLLASKNYEEALTYAEAASDIFETIGNAKGWEVGALGTLVRCKAKLKQFEEATSAASEAARRFASVGDDLSEAQALSYVMETRLEQEDTQAALEMGMKAIDRLRSASNAPPTQDLFLASLLHTVAQVKIGEEAFLEAKDLCREALDLVKLLNEKPQEALVLHTLVNAHLGLKEFREAVKVAAESRDIFRKRQQKRGTAYSCLVCSHAYAARGDTNRAVSMAKEALTLFTEAQHQLGIAESTAMLAEVYLARGNFPKAASFGEEALSLFRERGEEMRILEQLFLVSKANFFVANKGGTPQKIGEKPSKAWDHALMSAQATLEQARRLGLETAVAAALFSIGQIQVITRRPADATKTIEEALPLVQSLEDLRAEGNIEILSAQLNIMVGKEMQALEPAQRAAEIFKEKLPDKDLEDVAVELIRFIQGGGGGGGAVADEEGDGEGGGGGEAAGAPTEYQGPTVEDLVATITDVALSLMGVDDLDGDTPLMDAGLDSLASVEFQNNLQKEFAGVQMPSTLVFDYPSVRTMSDFINSSLREAAGFKPLS